MFTQPKPNTIVSDTGFSVEMRGMGPLIYREGPRTLICDAELMAPGTTFYLVIYADQVKNWEAPHAAEPLDDHEKKRIFENIKAAYRSIGEEIDVESLIELNKTGWPRP
jgi:hypothetical protein